MRPSGPAGLRRQKASFGLAANNIELFSGVAAGRFVEGDLVSGGNVLADELFQLVLGGRKVGLFGHRPRFLGGLFGELDDCLDDFLARIMREQDGAEHDFFRKLVGFGFDHHHRVVGGGNHEVEIAFGNLLVGGVQDIFAVQITHARRADGAHERNARNRHRCGSGYQCEDIGFVMAVIAQNLRNRS